MPTLIALVLAAPFLGVAAQAPAEKFVWIEAESPTRTNFPPAERNPFAPVNPTEAAVLSGGKWIGFTGKRTSPIFAEYTVKVPASGSYQLYARKFWKHGPYRWRFDGGAWTSIGPEVALLDSEDLRQFIGANWSVAGKATLTAGNHTLRVESTTDDGAIAFDAFVLTSEPFIPRGKLRPGEKLNRANEGYFPFEPDADRFAPTPIDLRTLNEAFAGENGRIEVKGETLIHAKNGKEVRFWASNCGNDALELDDASLKLFARSMAKQGVNLVRLHGPVWGQDWSKAATGHVAKIHRFVAAMKAEGIYSCLSIYFPLWLDMNESMLPGYGSGKKPFAAQFFNPTFIANYRRWWSDVLTTPNPATGKALRDDPALAIVELVNEDSFFFWTFTPYENLPASQMAILERMFGDWLTRKYGSLNAAFQAWGSTRMRGDDASAGRAGFPGIWQMANQRQDARSIDSVTFLGQLQRRWFDEQTAYLKRDLKYRGLVYGSNWVTGDAAVLGPVDKWSNTGADVMDRHGYFDVGHEGEGASYSVRQGHTFEDMSALKFPRDQFSLPIFDIRYDGKPSTITELNWTAPNRLRADLPLVSAAYGLLQGTDAIYFFATGSPTWESSIGKFGLRTPVMAGQFPAAAWMYRQGLVKPGPVAVEANLSLRRLFRLEGVPIQVSANLDAMRAADVPGTVRAVNSVPAVDPLAFLVGKVAVNFTADEKESRVMNLRSFIDRAKKVVRSATGELTWDYGTGLVKVDAPQAQGITGFLSQGELDTTSVQAKLPLEYGAMLLVSMDGKPIAESGKMLLQVMSQEAPFGFATSGRGKLKIENVGRPPIGVQKFRGSVSLKRSDASSLKVTSLDFNGYPKQKVGNAARIELQPDVLYYIIEK